MRRSGLFAGLVAVGLAAAAPAHAVTVWIGLQQVTTNSGLITTVAHDNAGPSTAAFFGSYGTTFTTNLITATGLPTVNPPDVLDSTSFDITSVGGTQPNDLYVYISSLDNYEPFGVLRFNTQFTSNALPAGWTVTEQTWLDLTDTKYLAAGTLLGSAMFTSASVGLNQYSSKVADAGSGPYALTHFYHIHTTSAGQAQLTVNLSAVPLPAGLPLFLSGILGLPLVGRWLRRQNRERPSPSVVAC